MQPIKAPAPLAQINGGGGSQVGRLQDNSISLCFPVKTLEHSERRSSVPLMRCNTVNTRQIMRRAFGPLGAVGVMKHFLTEAGGRTCPLLVILNTNQ